MATTLRHAAANALSAAAFMVLSTLATSLTSAASAAPPLTASERQAILSHGPWPPKLPDEPSNRGATHPSAIAAGKKLFEDPRFSRDGRVACATCHQPRLAFTDGRPVSAGYQPLTRNAQSVLNVGFNRWFGWDGQGDSLWGQSLRPLLSPAEMDSNPARVAAIIRTDAGYARDLRAAFGDGALQGSDEATFVLVGKALAAYQRTLISGRSAFDRFRDALANNEPDALLHYPEPALRGLRIFVGRGKCNACHFGPHFTNHEFGDLGLPHFLPAGGVDKGRWGGIDALRTSPFNLLGNYNDDSTKSTAAKTRNVRLQQRNWGEFRVPSLRDIERTGPYMHAGTLPTLHDVVRHYSEINEERLHADGEKLLRPLNLTAEEIDALVAFLVSLTGDEQAR